MVNKVIKNIFYRLLRLESLEKERKEIYDGTKDHLEDTDKTIEEQLQRFYLSLQDLRNHKEGKPTLDLQEHTEYWVNDSSRMINFYLNQKKTLLSMLESPQSPIELPIFSNLVYYFKEASELVTTEDIAKNLRERRNDLIDNIGVNYLQ